MKIKKKVTKPLQIYSKENIESNKKINQQNKWQS